jgi:hypothetical protein
MDNYAAIGYYTPSSNHIHIIAAAVTNARSIAAFAACDTATSLRAATPTPRPSLQLPHILAASATVIAAASAAIATAATAAATIASMTAASLLLHSTRRRRRCSICAWQVPEKWREQLGGARAANCHHLCV